MTQALRPLLSKPREEYCLALLLQHPELKARCQELSPEYFESSETREIFLAYKQAEDVQSIKEQLDTAIWEHFDSLISRSLPSSQIEQKFGDCVLNLRTDFLRSLETKKEMVLAQEAELGSAAELAKLEEQGIDVSVQLRKLFDQRSQGRPRAKEVINGLGQQ